MARGCTETYGCNKNWSCRRCRFTLGLWEGPMEGLIKIKLRWRERLSVVIQCMDYICHTYSGHNISVKGNNASASNMAPFQWYFTFPTVLWLCCLHHCIRIKITIWTIISFAFFSSFLLCILYRFSMINQFQMYGSREMTFLFGK